MNHTEFRDQLADLLGLPRKHMVVVDRALAGAGLRTKGAGRHSPAIRHSEGLMLLLAAMAAPVATRAHEDAGRWYELPAKGPLKSQVGKLHNIERDASDFIGFFSNWKDYSLGHALLILGSWKKYSGRVGDVAEQLERAQSVENPSGLFISNLTLALSHGYAELRMGGANAPLLMHFGNIDEQFLKNRASAFGMDGDLKRISRVSELTLDWIAEKTEDGDD